MVPAVIGKNIRSLINYYWDSCFSPLTYLVSFHTKNSGGIYLLKVNNGNTTAKYEICSNY